MHPRRSENRFDAPAAWRLHGLFTLAAWAATSAFAQSTPAAMVAGHAAGPASAGPIAIVPLGTGKSVGTKVTGALEVTNDKALIAASGAITSGTETTEVLLPHRGTLRVCASTTVKLAADSSMPAGDTPGLMMALDHGAMEASFAAGRNADFVLTPDFRILIGGPGAVEVKVRLGQHGDTCVDNPGEDAPYVLVTSVFDGGVYRVQPGQRVMFEHGSVHEVVDQEKEPCGCPTPPKTGSNEFPMAQSAGLAPMPAPKPSPVHPPGEKTALTEPLVYKSQSQAPEPVTVEPQEKAANPATASSPAPAAKPHQKKHGFLGSIGRFFRHIFGGA